MTVHKYWTPFKKTIKYKKESRRKKLPLLYRVVLFLVD